MGTQTMGVLDELEARAVTGAIGCWLNVELRHGAPGAFTPGDTSREWFPRDELKPYQCGDEPTHHDHYSEPDSRGARFVDRVEGRESECDQCTGPVPTPNNENAGI